MNLAPWEKGEFALQTPKRMRKHSPFLPLVEMTQFWLERNLTLGAVKFGEGKLVRGRLY